ncbi:MAG TPA: NAD(P)-dependent alcohol dehydrogenase [Myxococcales bacterium]|nr:NAD(P)-dependent alcohol dehydrogenase [Myxococcales bacterium]
MRALQYDAYGGIERLVLRDVPVPSLPGRGRAVLVRVVRAALNPKDALFRKGRFRLISGRRFPKWCGLDFAGEVTASNSPRVRVGERVFGALDEWRLGRGTLAEYVVTSEDELAPLPDGVGFEEGAAVALVGLTALQALRDVARMAPGAEVLINGASGGVGTVAIQIARLLGARVTSVSSAANLQLCAELGAEETLDYDRGGFLGQANRFDCIFDVFGNLSFARARTALKARGTFVSTVPSLSRALRDVVSRWSARSGWSW